MKEQVPSLSTVIDVLTARLEYAQASGLAAEARVMREALTAVEDHIFRDERHLSWIDRILERLHAGRMSA